MFWRKPPSPDPTDRAIDNWTERLLENAATNHSFIPDAWEKRIYTHLFKMLLGNLRAFLETLQLDVLNHRITVHIAPLDTVDVPDPADNV